MCFALLYHWSYSLIEVSIVSGNCLKTSRWQAITCIEPLMTTTFVPAQAFFESSISWNIWMMKITSLICVFFRNQGSDQPIRQQITNTEMAIHLWRWKVPLSVSLCTSISGNNNQQSSSSPQNHFFMFWKQYIFAHQAVSLTNFHQHLLYYMSPYGATRPH